MSKLNVNDLTRNQLTQMAVSVLGLKPKSTIHPSTREMAFHCPFHKDKTPSLFINFDKGVFKCFSCERKGSIESLFWELTNTNMYKALDISTDPISCYMRTQTMDYTESEEQEYDTKLKQVDVVYDPRAMRDFMEYPECIAYLRKRGISLKVARDLGFCYIDEETEINCTKFSKRLAIPVYEGGKLISIEGRKIEKSTEPKVLYPRNCTVNTLFDIDNLDRSKPLFAVEGLMDLAVLRGSKAFANSTSIFGASITNRQISLIRDFKEFIYIPDNDDAGLRTVARLKESKLSNLSILKLYKELRGVELKDVGDLPKTGFTPDDLVARSWLSHIERFSTNSNET